MIKKVRKISSSRRTYSEEVKEKVLRLADLRVKDNVNNYYRSAKLVREEPYAGKPLVWVCEGSGR